MKGRKIDFYDIKFIILVPFFLYFLIALSLATNYITVKKIRISNIESFIEIEEEFVKRVIVDYLNFHGMKKELTDLKNEISSKIKLEKINIINSSGMIVSSTQKEDLQSQIQDERILTALRKGKGDRIQLKKKKDTFRYLSIVPLKPISSCYKCHEMKKENSGAILLNFLISEELGKGENSYLILPILIFSTFLPIMSLFILRKSIIKPLKSLKGREIEDLSDQSLKGIKNIIDYAKFLEEKTELQKIELSFFKQKISEIKNELNETYEKLFQSERLASLGTLLAGLSHEINNPVGTIVSRCDCLLLEGSKKNYPAEIIEDIKTIKFHAKRISNLIYSLINFSKLTSDEKKECNINEIIETVLLFVDSQFKKDKIEIEKRLMFGLPKVFGNETQLQQVFLNIINNAKEALPEGGKILIETQAPLFDERFIKVIISDNGEGIPKEKIKKIFEPFFTTKKSGTGLGLFLCYNIIRSHGGEIEIQSEEGKGTRVIVKIPFIDIGHK